MQFFSSISNLFEHKNSIQIADDAIYPVDFVRTWRVGMKADF
jgi:iron complex outermembrane receptor protein